MFGETRNGYTAIMCQRKNLNMLALADIRPFPLKRGLHAPPYPTLGIGSTSRETIMDGAMDVSGGRVDGIWV